MSMLGRMDGASQKDLAEALCLRPASISELIDKLERVELVSRRPNEEDKRSFKVFLTENGRESARAAESGRREFADGLLRDFTEEERETFSSLLDRTLARLEALTAPEGGEGPGAGEKTEGSRPHGRRRGSCDDDCPRCADPCGKGRRPM